VPNTSRGGNESAIANNLSPKSIGLYSLVLGTISCRWTTSGDAGASVSVAHALALSCQYPRVPCCADIETPVLYGQSVFDAFAVNRERF